MANADRLLYLYSSNARLLYEQDILDVLAAAPGMSFQFRYRAKYVERETAKQWKNLTGCTALISYSLQQEERFHDAAFIPIRLAEVTRAFCLGEIYVVQLRAKGYVALREPDDIAPAGLDGPVRRYREYLRQHDVPMPYDAAAGVAYNILRGDSVPLEIGGDQMLLFGRTCRYLQKTISFRDARFYRFLGLSEGIADGRELEVEESGLFVLESGKDYELALVHQQPTEVPESQQFLIGVDNSVIHLTGIDNFDISARYDLVTVPFFTVESTNYNTRDTFLVIEAKSVQAARLRIPIRVRSPFRRAVTAVSGSVVGLLLLGFPALFPQLAAGIKLVFILTGGLLTGTLATLGLKRA